MPASIMTGQSNLREIKMSKHDQTFKDLNRAQTPSALSLVAGAVAGVTGLYIFALLVLSL